MSLSFSLKIMWKVYKTNHHKKDKGKRQETSTTGKFGMRQLSFPESVDRRKNRKKAENGKNPKIKVNCKILDTIKADKKRLKRHITICLSRWRNVSIRWMRCIKKYDKIKINLIEQEDTFMARYVKTHIMSNV